MLNWEEEVAPALAKAGSRLQWSHNAHSQIKWQWRRKLLRQLRQ
jgi:hypothetical protein